MSNTQRQFLEQSLISVSSNDPFQKKRCDIPKANKQKSLLSTIFFTYIYSFLSSSSNNGVSVDLMPPLANQDQIQHTHSKLMKQIELLKHAQTKNKFLKILKNVFGRQVYVVLILSILVCGMKMYAPLLCAQIILYVQKRQQRSGQEGITLLIVTILLNIIRSLTESQLNYRLGLLGTNLSSNLSLLIYNKSLKYPLLRQKVYSSSDIINLSQIDCERIGNLGNQLSSLVATPLQLIIGITIMWFFIGISFLSGIITAIIMIGVTFFISKQTIKLNIKVLTAKDKRMKATQQMLDNIRFIKINALQQLFLDRIKKQRQIELQFYKKKGWCQAIGYFVYWLTGPIILFTTFTTYILIGNQITSQSAFTTIMIFSMLQYPIRQLPTSISEIIQLFASLTRIQSFLFAKEIKQNRICFNQLPYGDCSIKISDGHFYWKRQQDDKQLKYVKILKKINIQIKRDKLTIIMGQVGCGKSSLILAIMNQMKIHKDSNIEIFGKIGFCSQTPWILSSTLRNNITLFKQYNEFKFKKAIYYSRLEQDIQKMPLGDLTQIGEKGVNISGGQKARISLARALYADPNIYLLDDILSAIDVHSADFIIKHTIKQYLTQKTVLLVTHKVHYARLADYIIYMKRGKIEKYGRSQNIIKLKDFKKLCSHERKHVVQDSKDREMELIKLALRQKQKDSSGKQKNDRIVEQLMIPEQQQMGQIKLNVFKQYIDYNGGMVKFGLIVLLAMTLWILSSTFASIYMSIWCTNPSQNPNGLIIYSSLSLSSSIFIFIRASMLILSGVRQGQKVHNKMITSLLKASLIKFYNRVPAGRILNRLTKDLRELDEAIGPAIGGLLVCFFQMIGTISICIYSSTPYLLIPTVLLGYACFKLKKYYLDVQRQVTRIQKITNTPIINGFISTLSGLQSVRAYKLQSHCLSSQQKLLNDNKKVRIIKQSLQNWFSLNLSYLSLIVNTLAIGYCIFYNENGAVAGLLITYALNLSSDINLTILCFSYFETKVISLERMYQFTQIEPEQKQKINYEYEVKGPIHFINTSVRYRQDLPDILQQINLTINRGEKIGIAGSSGSGKTSILNALLKITHISNGDILINHKSLNSFSIQQLRKEITIIDQEPFILKGSMRENIDPLNQFEDEQINKLLIECQMLQNIKLSTQIDSQSLSAGEKQLLCLFRGFIRRNQIILIDQATSKIDQKTDHKIQQFIKNCFRNSTVLTIAHRLQTLKESDKILILDSGKIVQFGSPNQLLSQKGAYYSMVRLNNL